jgi:hypothetical protein
MSRVYPPSSPLHWTCEVCNAGADQRCTTPSGRRAPIHANRWEAVRLWERYGKGHQACTDPQAHAAHLQTNGECPWCGGTKPLTPTHQPRNTNR